MVVVHNILYILFARSKVIDEIDPRRSWNAHKLAQPVLIAQTSRFDPGRRFHFRLAASLDTENCLSPTELIRIRAFN